MSTVKSKKLQVGTDATSSNNFTIYQPSTPDGTLRIGVGNADSPTEVGQFNANGYKPQQPVAFSYYNSATQSVPINVFTKITWNTEEYDTNSNFSSSRFTPTVAGYYLISCQIGANIPSAMENSVLALHKNGNQYIRGGGEAFNTGSGNGYWHLSHPVYANGTTDYFEIYFFQSSGGNMTVQGGDKYNGIFRAILISQA